VTVVLLTGGKDAHYVRGLVRQLVQQDIRLVVVGSSDMADVAGIDTGQVEFRDLIGDGDPDVPLSSKVVRLLRYYVRLVRFSARADATLFHILWFRKFPKLERVILSLYLKLLRKQLLFTAHNVDDDVRDGKPTVIGTLSLRLFYTIVDHIFVHTARSQAELVDRFHVPLQKVTILPFGTNDVVPVLDISRSDARQKLAMDKDRRVLLFFGNLAPYKGVEDLVGALGRLVAADPDLVLIVCGRPKDKSCAPYWSYVERLISDLGVTAHVRKEIRYVTDHEAALFFKAADVSILPYRRIYQSGVLALSYAQGLPVIVPDIGSMKDDVVQGETGFVFRTGDVDDLAKAIRSYFTSSLFAELDTRTQMIQKYGTERFSWPKNAELTVGVYRRTLEVNA
jgi:glycosyltransferase involved in cell wall biosynthesis